MRQHKTDKEIIDSCMESHMLLIAKNQDLEKELAELKEATRWRSVEDELPEGDEEYLIWPHHKYSGATASFNKFTHKDDPLKDKFIMTSEYGEVTEVYATHWMPIPTKGGDS